MARGAGSPGDIGGTKAQVLPAFFILAPAGRIGRAADFSPKGRLFSEPLDFADLVRFWKRFDFRALQRRW